MPTLSPPDHSSEGCLQWSVTHACAQHYKIFPLPSSSSCDNIIIGKKGLCHSEPLKHPGGTEAVWLGPLCNAAPWLQHSRQICRRKSDFCPEICNLSYVLPAVLSISHYLLPCTVILGLSSYLKSTNESAQVQLTFSSKSFQKCSIHMGKNSHQVFIFYSFDHL